MSTEIKLDKSDEIALQAAGLIMVLIATAANQPGFDIESYTRQIEQTLEKMQKKGAHEALLIAARETLKSVNASK